VNGKASTGVFLNDLSLIPQLNVVVIVRPLNLYNREFSKAESYQVNKCTTIIDGKSYLESLIAMISRNWENPTFHPTIEQLWEFREKWENKEA
jgi:hypothetical protein